MKEYEKLATTPIAVTPEREVLAASGEVTNCRIDPINVTVDNFQEVTIEKTFDFSLE